MADWTTISDTSVDPDAPLTSQLGYAWRDNPIAIAEGAVGAPRVTVAGQMAPTAGDTYTLSRMLNVTGVISNTVRSEVLRVQKAGTIRVVFDWANGSGTGVNSVHLYRHGASKTSVFSNSTALASGTATTDVAVSRGDMVYVEVTSGTSTVGSMSNFVIKSGADGGFVA